MLKDEVYWYNLLKPQTTELDKDVTVDVAVVGGGMAGLMCAQKVREQGLSVAVVEAEFCGAGASGKSSGFITPDSELQLSDLVDEYSDQPAKELWEFVMSGCEAIRKNILDNNFDCDYQIQDSLFVANSQSGRKQVQAEHAARQKLNYPSTIYEADHLPSVLGSIGFYGAVRYPGTFGMTSYLYCQELKNLLIKQGVEVYERIPVRKFDDHQLFVGKHTVTAQSIIFSADHFLPALGLVPKDVYHAQTFLSISKPLSVEDRKKIFPRGNLMVWDTDLIYQYFRLTGEGRLLLGGSSLYYTYRSGEKHLPHLVVNKLQNYLIDKFPQVKIDLEYLWPGLIGVSKDFLPVAGQHHELTDVYYIGGAAGLPWAAALGQYVAEKVTGDAKPSLDQYFATPRKYPIPYAVQSVVGKPIAFALSHGIVKYLR